MIFGNTFNYPYFHAPYSWKWPDISGWKKLGALSLIPLLASAPLAAEEGETVKETRRILALGDSLTAGFMLDQYDSFPAQLEAALRAEGYNISILNAGVSGDTTQGGLARLSWSLGDKPDYAIVELGANDALRGIAPDHAYENLDTIITMLRERDIPVFLVGILAPRNMGKDYVEAFDAIYPTLQKKYQIPLYPFVLEGVVGDPALTLPDGIHPSAKGVAVMVKNMLPAIKLWLDNTSLSASDPK